MAINPELNRGYPSLLWHRWRDSLPPSVIGELSKEFTDCLDLAATLRTEFESHQISPDNDRLAVVMSVFSGDRVLPATLLYLTNQIQTLGKSADIFVVLNGGGGTASRFFENTDWLSGVPIDEVLFGNTQSPRTKEEAQVNQPRKIVLSNANNECFLNHSSGIRLTIINQQPTDQVIENGVVHSFSNRGKIRALRDLFAYLGHLYDSGYHPRYLLTLDDESILFGKQKGIGEDHEALGTLFDCLNNGISRVVTARTMNAVYTENGPDLNALTFPHSAGIHLLHGIEGFKVMSGPASLWYFRDLVPIAEAVTRIFPGVRGEDILFTALAVVFSLQIKVHPSTFVTNRVSGPFTEGKSMREELGTVNQQFCRWLKDLEVLQHNWGPSISSLIANASLRSMSSGLIKRFFDPNERGLFTPREVGLMVLAIPFLFYSKAKVHRQDYDLVNGNPGWKRSG